MSAIDAVDGSSTGTGAVRRSSPQDNLRASRMVAEAIQRLNILPIPTIALVQGACFGGGIPSYFENSSRSASACEPLL
jgi:enoyl-CoA hydratase/carnithine racemase